MTRGAQTETWPRQSLFHQHFVELYGGWEPMPEPEPDPPRGRFASFGVAAWAALMIAFAALALAAVVFYYSITLPDPRVAGLTRTPPNLTILAADGRFIAERGMRRQYVSFADLPKHLIDAVIAAEDRRFRYHFGFDPIGMARAALRNWRAERIVEGGSTLTQQLAKNLFLKPNRTWTRKVEEVILSLWLEARYTKDEIAELYFNRVYFGAGNYGVGAAAYHYFGKEPSRMTLAECALLVGLIKAPAQYSPTHNLQGARDRARIVLKAMAESGVIGLEEYGLALAQPAQFHTLPATPGYEHLVDWVVELVPDLVGEVEHNLVVETSINADMQAAAWRAVKTVMGAMGPQVRAGEAAVVAMTPEGRVSALIGGMNYQLSQFNRAVDAQRQPGSAFKPFIYLAAAEQGYKPDDRILDAPVRVGDWRPGNYGGVYRGEITLRRAMADSSNMAAVRLMQDVGLQRVVATARRLGVTTALRDHPTLALGASDVTLFEMTAAYASFANGGLATAPQVIDRIIDENGRVIFQRSATPGARVMSEGALAAMNDMLLAVAEGGTGQWGRLPGWHVAAKTGTSQRYRDAWFVGFTPYYVGGVWMGNDNNLPMKGVTGGSLPAEIWRMMMAEPHRDRAFKPLPGVRRPPPPAPPPIIARDGRRAGPTSLESGAARGTREREPAERRTNLNAPKPAPGGTAAAMTEARRGGGRESGSGR